jgi:spore germination protein GerM
VFLNENGKLYRATRKVKPPVNFDELLRELKDGPTRAELAGGVRSAVPDDDTFESATFSGGTAIVDLAKPFNARSSNDQLLALAQIVYTMTARPGVGQVQFTLQGSSIDTPRADGTVTTGPVSRNDYLPLATGG